MALYRLGDHAVETPANGRFWIADNAIVLGRVSIAEDVSIWFNAVVRGDNDAIAIGARSNVQDGSVLHADPGFPLTIEAGCTIGHMVMLHGCTIGAGSLIGIGAIVLNGAKIGEDCLIGAGTLIPEGKVIPPRSVVMGTPGKVIRAVSESDLARMRMSTQAYVDRWPDYRERFTRQV